MQQLFQAVAWSNIRTICNAWVNVWSRAPGDADAIIQLQGQLWLGQSFGPAHSLLPGQLLVVPVQAEHFDDLCKAGAICTCMQDCFTAPSADILLLA